MSNDIRSRMATDCDVAKTIKQAFSYEQLDNPNAKLLCLFVLTDALYPFIAKRSAHLDLVTIRQSRSSRFAPFAIASVIAGVHGAIFSIPKDLVWLSQILLFVCAICAAISIVLLTKRTSLVISRTGAGCSCIVTRLCGVPIRRLRLSLPRILVHEVTTWWLVPQSPGTAVPGRPMPWNGRAIIAWWSSECFVVSVCGDESDMVELAMRLGVAADRSDVETGCQMSCRTFVTALSARANQPVFK